MEHVDRAQLYTDVQYRFQYVSKFMGFGAEDIQVIKDAAPVVAPLVPAVVNAVYVKLFSFDITKEVFLKRNEGFTGNLADSQHLSLDSEQITFRKDMLSKYLTKLVTAEYDANFVKYLDRVGKIHTPKMGNKSINVEYIHCNALMGYVEDILINAVLEHKDVDHPTKVKLIRALNKLLWIQMDLFARHYVNDGEDITALQQ